MYTPTVLSGHRSTGFLHLAQSAPRPHSAGSNFSPPNFSRNFCASLRREPIEVRKATLKGLLRRARPGIAFNPHHQAQADRTRRGLQRHRAAASGSFQRRTDLFFSQAIASPSTTQDRAGKAVMAALISGAQSIDQPMSQFPTSKCKLQRPRSDHLNRRSIPSKLLRLASMHPASHAAQVQ
jgi:hypothetical protein